MKKYITFLLCLIIILLMCSCKANEDKDAISQNDSTNKVPTQISDAQKAMQMYEAAIKGEICVLDKDFGEIKLQDCRFPNSNLRLGECEILYKAIFDMDGDCINEYVIQSETKDHIVLRYYNGNVYSYCFENKDFFNLCTDGSYYWIDSYEIDNCTRGLNQM